MDIGKGKTTFEILKELYSVHDCTMLLKLVDDDGKILRTVLSSSIDIDFISSFGMKIPRNYVYAIEDSGINHRKIIIIALL